MVVAQYLQAYRRDNQCIVEGICEQQNSRTAEQQNNTFQMLVEASRVAIEKNDKFVKSEVDK